MRERCKVLCPVTAGVVGMVRVWNQRCEAFLQLRKKHTKGFGRGQVQHIEYNSFTRWLYLEVSELKYSVTNSFIKEPYPFLMPTPSEDASKPRHNNYSAHISVVLFWVEPSGV